MKSIGLIILFLLINHTFVAQTLNIGNLHFRNTFNADTLSLSISNHSSVKPYINHIGIYKDHLLSVPVKQNGNLYPVISTSVGGDMAVGITSELGLGLGFDINRNKLAFTGKVMPFMGRGGYVIDSIHESLDIFPGLGRTVLGDLFVQGELIAAYQPNNFFSFSGGIGKNFFGEGYRSLLLSDNAAPSPFLKIETSFWSIKYVNLFNVWTDFYKTDTHHKDDITKLSAIHYLSWNITKRFNLSVFETVVWQAKDSLTNRYFEPNYMNPFVLYRPVEYALGSADNVLLGLNLSYKPDRKTTIYSQLILDEFYLTEIKARNQWWANKFGTQIGVKSTSFLVPDLFVQAEFNLVRPFTYSHKESPQSYGHANASVTHPIGANFYEFNTMLSYPLGKHRLSMQTIYALYGSDTSDINYGQNIFESYSDRGGNYDQYIGQGEKQQVLSCNFYYEFPLNLAPHLYFISRYQLRIANSNHNFKQNHSFEIGIRTRIWNRYDDF